jgi:hypothetical protein
VGASPDPVRFQRRLGRLFLKVFVYGIPIVIELQPSLNISLILSAQAEASLTWGASYNVAQRMAYDLDTTTGALVDTSSTGGNGLTSEEPCINVKGSLTLQTVFALTLEIILFNAISFQFAIVPSMTLSADFKLLPAPATSGTDDCQIFLNVDGQVDLTSAWDAARLSLTMNSFIGSIDIFSRGDGTSHRESLVASEVGNVSQSSGTA